MTLGLVFIGQYFFFEWNEMTGGAQVGRDAAKPAFLGIEFTVDEGFKGGWTEEQKLYWLFLVVLVVAAVVARNVARSRVGRAFAAIRDRDVAAGVMGVNLTRYKVVAFTISSFYAGIAGALMFSGSGHFTPESFNLLLSVQFIAIVLIGGVADHLRHDHGRDADRDPAADRQRAAGIRALPVELGQRAPEHLRLRADHVRRPDRGVPALRATRPLRHLAPHPHLLEELPLSY